MFFRPQQSHVLKHRADNQGSIGKSRAPSRCCSWACSELPATVKSRLQHLLNPSNWRQHYSHILKNNPICSELQMCAFIFEFYWSFWVALLGCTFWVVCLSNAHTPLCYILSTEVVCPPPPPSAQLWRKVLERLLLLPLCYDPSRSWKCSTSRRACSILTHAHS